MIPDFDSGDEKDLETSFFSQNVSKLQHQSEGENLISYIIKEASNQSNIFTQQ